MLENRLDKAMIKYNEAQSIRKTYEQIVKRLKVTTVDYSYSANSLAGGNIICYLVDANLSSGSKVR